MHYAPEVTPQHTYDHARCHRCGITRTVNRYRPATGLCRDCYDVTRELHELDQWRA